MPSLAGSARPRGNAEGRGRGSLSGAAPDGAEGVDRGGVGALADEPAGEVVPADARGGEAAARGGVELVALRGGDGEGAGGDASAGVGGAGMRQPPMWR